MTARRSAAVGYVLTSGDIGHRDGRHAPACTGFDNRRRAKLGFDIEHENRACDSLERYAADDIHVHELPPPKHGFQGGVAYDLSFMKALGMRLRWA